MKNLEIEQNYNEFIQRNTINLFRYLVKVFRDMKESTSNDIELHSSNYIALEEDDFDKRVFSIYTKHGPQYKITDLKQQCIIQIDKEFPYEETIFYNSYNLDLFEDVSSKVNHVEHYQELNKLWKIMNFMT